MLSECKGYSPPYHQLMRLRPGSRFNQAIKGYFCTESSDQGVRKSGDQAPLES